MFGHSSGPTFYFDITIPWYLNYLVPIRDQGLENFD